jgi:site-specific recombinase XerD
LTEGRRAQVRCFLRSLTRHTIYPELILPVTCRFFADIESFARKLEARGRARGTVIWRLCTIAGLYKYDVAEELLDHSPAAHVRHPRVDHESALLLGVRA